MDNTKKNIKINNWIVNDEFMFFYYKIVKDYFKDIFQLEDSKVFYIGYKELMERYLLNKSNSENIIQSIIPPFMNLNMTTHKFDRTKMNYKSNVQGITYLEGEKYYLELQYVYLISTINANLFLNSRGNLLKYETLILSTFDVPQVYINSNINLKYLVPPDEDKNSNWNIPITLILNMNNFTDQSQYEFSNDLRTLRLSLDFTIQGSIPLKIRWTSKIDNIHLTISEYNYNYESVLSKTDLFLP